MTDISVVVVGFTSVVILSRTFIPCVLAVETVTTFLENLLLNTDEILVLKLW